jgi:Ca2+-binding RTX toxin-like protein
MATYTWSELTDGQSIAFDPAVDVLVVDGGVVAASVWAVFDSSSISLSWFKTVTLLTDPTALTPASINFIAGGMLLIGDGTSDTSQDSAANVLTGSSGDDHLDGLGGDDTLRGGDGDDVYIVDSTHDVVDEQGSNEWADMVLAYASVVMPLNVEILVLLGTEAINCTGNDQTNNIIGNDAGNVLEGGRRWDRLEGRWGNDTIRGGSGGDQIFGDYQTISNHVIQFDADVLFGNGGNDYLYGGFGNCILRGGSGDDRLYGWSGQDSLIGGEGNDTLQGGEDSDVLIGGKGNNLMMGGLGDDFYIINSRWDVVVEDGGGTDKVESSVTVTLAALVEDLTLTGSRNINGTGNGRPNQLVGNSGNNVLDGRNGADWVDGQDGNDILIWDPIDLLRGGAGYDRLKVTDGDLNLRLVANDRIKDVESIDLRGGGENRLTLALSDILKLSSTTDTVRVFGDAQDSVDLRGSFELVGTSGNFNIYQIETATLLVDMDVRMIA